MKKWQILIIGAGPKLVSVGAANEIVADLLEDGQNVKQAVLTVEGGAPDESANLLHERDVKIAEGKSIVIKPRKRIHGSVALGIEEAREIKEAADDIRVKELQVKLQHSDDEMKLAAGLLEKFTASNEQLEREKSDVLETVKLQQGVIADLEKKLAAAEAASPLAAVAVSEVK